MNLAGKFRNALSEIKQIEGQYLDKVKKGSKDPHDMLELSYFSGLRNGFNFVWYQIDHPKEVSEQKFDEMLKQILRLEKAN
jgi:hypothetical protein